jgi:putative spermidine/putrescine transport system ATP-binding protein
VLSGRVIDPGAGRIAVDGQEIATATSIANHAPGSPVSVALRPESIVLGDGVDGANRLRGPIDDVSFLGSVVRIRIRLDGLAEGVALDVFNDPNLRIPDLGSVVSVAFSREACIVLDEGVAAPAGAPLGKQALA